MSHPLRRSGLAASIGSVAACFVIAGSAMAAYWDPTVTLRTSPFQQIEDLVAAGTGVGVGWSEYIGGQQQLFARSSTTSGSSFRTRYRLVLDTGKDARSLGLDVGASQLWSTWTEDRENAAHPDRWRLVIGQRDLASGADLNVGYATLNERTASNPDIAYGGGRIWIGYQEQAGTGSAFHIKVWRSFSGAVGVDATVVDLGPAPLAKGQAQFAAVPTRGYAAWAAADGIHFRSATVGAAPGYPTSWNAPQVLAGGGQHPIMGVGGDQVIVAWSQGGDLWLRISNDKGAHFLAARRIADGSFPHDVWQPEDLDIAGSRIALVASEQSDDANVGVRFQSFNGGSTWSSPTTIGPFTFRYDDFVSVAGVTKLCEAWAEEFVGPDPHHVFFRRQH
jgi:hypothetical protein